MAVILHDAVEGKSAGDTYEGPNEKFLVENGYARYKGKRKFDLDHPSGVDYVHGDSEELPFEATPTGPLTPDPVAPETQIQANPPAAPEPQGPAAPTVKVEPAVAPETLL